MSVNLGYGGNVIFLKKCFVFRIVSYLGRKEGWFVEYMFIVGIEDLSGKVIYIVGVFLSVCGKINFVMLILLEFFKKFGYKVWIVGDDIVWMRIGEDGRLWVINFEVGFFGVVSGISYKINLNVMEIIKRNMIYINVFLKEDGIVWWEGMDGEVLE